MKTLNLLLIFFCMISQNVFAKSIICSDSVKIESEEENKKEIFTDELEMQIHPIEDTDRSYINFKFHRLIDNTGPELPINLNLKQFNSPFKFEMRDSNYGLFSFALTPIEKDRQTFFIDLKMHMDLKTESYESIQIDHLDISGLMKCHWTQTPQLMR
ncbi:MAG: hypothetical protein ACXVCY_10510 [Pseudobdellovibrionaceae bacterium]